MDRRTEGGGLIMGSKEVKTFKTCGNCGTICSSKAVLIPDSPACRDWTTIPITMGQYADDVARTADTNLSRRDALACCAMSLGEEAGEAAGPIKKYLYHGHAENPDKVAEELGDLLFYIAWAAALNGLTVNEILVRNMEKRRERYPEGFDQQRSINRKG